jgi:hypothetical protein
MQNLTVHLGSATPFSSRAGPRAPVCQTHLPSLAATGARPRWHQRTAVRTATCRPRAPRPGHGRPGHDRGAACRSGPGPTMPPRATWHSRGRTPPSPSRQISSSAAAIFPLSGERPPSFIIPKLELTPSSPSRTGAAGPLSARRRPPEPPCRR